MGTSLRITYANPYIYIGFGCSPLFLLFCARATLLFEQLIVCDKLIRLSFRYPPHQTNYYRYKRAPLYSTVTLFESVTGFNFISASTY